MSIISLPAEILLAIFKRPELSLLDLKNIRLSHSSFRELAADRLLRRLHLAFELLHEKPKRLTSITQRINNLINRDPSEVQFRELSLWFGAVHRNGFSTFTKKTAKKLFSKLEALQRFEVTYAAKTANPWSRAMDPVLSNGLNRVLRAAGQLLNVSGLENSGPDKDRDSNVDFLQHLSAFSNLKRLTLNIKAIRAGGDDSNNNVYVPIAKAIVQSPGLEVLTLSYDRYPAYRTFWNGPQEVGLDGILDRVPATGVTALKELKLSGMRFATKGKNIAKLDQLEDLKVSASERGFPSAAWDAMDAFGVALKHIRGVDVRKCEELFGYIAKQKDIGRLEISPPPAYIDLEDEAQAEDNLPLGKLFRELAVPALGSTLRVLTLNVTVTLHGSKLKMNMLQLGSRTPPPPPADRSPPFSHGDTFVSLMDDLRGCDVLEELKLKITLHDDVWDQYALDKPELYALMEVCKGWKCADNGAHGWKEGLLLVAKMDYVPNYPKSRLRAVWALELVDGSWGFKCLRNYDLRRD